MYPSTAMDIDELITGPTRFMSALDPLTLFLPLNYWPSTRSESSGLLVEPFSSLLFPFSTTQVDANDVILGSPYTGGPKQKGIFCNAAVKLLSKFDYRLANAIACSLMLKEPEI